MSKETLKFKIGLSGTFWDKKPEYAVLLNDQKIAGGTIQDLTTEYVEFTADIEEGSDNKLIVRLENKTPSDTVQNEDKTAIVKDMLLNIDSVEIDDIDLGTLLWSTSTFIPDDAQFPETKECVNLGWNGSYIIKFNSPFYLWLLENM